MGQASEVSNMAREKHWSKVAKIAFTADGSSEGDVQVTDTQGFFVKQVIILKSGTEQRVDLEVKRVLSKTKLKVGPKSSNINEFADLSAFLVAEIALIYAAEQSKGTIPPPVIEQSRFEREPINADRSISVDYVGDLYTKSNPAPTLDRETAVLVNLKTLELLGIPLDDYVIADDEFVTLIDGTLIKASF